ncbi:MAG: efflux RND transporter permease subunit, partial [Tardiphaga sp.]
QVNTTAPALSPAEIEKQVTLRIETALGGIAGLESTRSISRNGFSQVTAVFAEATDIYFARQQVGERLLELRAILPAEVDPKMGPISTGLGEILMWSVAYAPSAAGVYVTPEGERLTSEVARAAYLRSVQDWIVKPQIRGVAGVAGVDSIGGFAKQYVVQPDPIRLIGLGLSFADLTRGIEASNVSRGASVIERNGEGIVVRAGGRLQDAADIEGVVVTTRGGVPIRISDVASVEIGGEIRTGSASMNGNEVVIGTALMLVGSNSRMVATAVEARLADVRRTRPPGIELTTVLDRTILVDATVKTVASNLGEGALLVIVVLFALLGNFRAALVIPLADRRRADVLGARHAVLCVGRGRLHRAVRHRRAQRAGDADLREAVDGARPGAARCVARGRADAAAAGGDDRAGRVTGLRADGARHWHRRRSTAPDRHRSDRRVDQRNAADAIGPAGVGGVVGK